MQGKPSPGFTLIELITVLVLLGVLAAFVAPRWFGRAEFAQRGYFDQMIQAARFAQKLAVTSNCEVQLTITANTFFLRQPASAAECGTGTITWSTEISLPSAPPPYDAPDSAITNSPTIIVFLASGRANVDAAVSVSGPDTYQFRVHQATGYVERL